MQFTSIIQIAFLFLIIFGIHVVWARRRIKQWAARNGYALLKCKICFVNIGPFSYFGTSGSQAVFRLEVMNKEGVVRKAYARAGGFLFGLLRDRVEVKWDKSLI